MRQMIRALLLSPLLLLPLPAAADQAVVENASATRQGDSWSISVTIRHPDTGWDHYADGWSVQLEDGTELGFRKLLHPHENEQPFTRSLGGISVPGDTTTLYIRAHDSVHGWSDARFELTLP